MDDPNFNQVSEENWQEKQRQELLDEVSSKGTQRSQATVTLSCLFFRGTQLWR